MLVGCACTAVAAKSLHSKNRSMQSSCGKLESYVYTGEMSANALAAPCSPHTALSTPELCSVTLRHRRCTACTMCSAARARFSCGEPSQASQPQMLPLSTQAALPSHLRPVL